MKALVTGGAGFIGSNIVANQAAFDYRPTVELEPGLAEYMAWARQEMA